MKNSRMAALWLVCIAPTFAQTQLARSPDEAYLDRLLGEWRMSGRLLGEPVRYRSRAERLVLTFPYAEGAFRDTFDYDPKTATWSLLLERQGTEGAWSEFARYTLSRM